ncbi:MULTISPECIES: MHYT domain-containing protein [unclassified Streptomyces]|uniref:MHYT domain-containing protein n=1 Tax=unclassified Streptomyces TaxID=2593676 RepID=UPI0033E947D7
MNGTVDGFSYGLVTPVAAYVMACLGAALGLRCVARTLHYEQGRRAAWLALGAACLGCGIWTMHFIGMIGFQVVQTSITYNVPLTVLSLVVAIVVVSVGVFIVGYRGAAPVPLTAAGVVTGLGVAAMHYLGMAAMHLDGELHYSAPVVALSVLIAVAAATAALWAAVTIRGFLPSLGASLVMGIAVSGMHYTGMAAVSVHLDATAGHASQGRTPTSLLLPMLIVPVVFLLVAAVIVMFDPVLILGDGEWSRGGRAGRREQPAPVEPSAFEPRTADPSRPQPHRR